MRTQNELPHSSGQTDASAQETAAQHGSDSGFSSCEQEEKKRGWAPARSDQRETSLALTMPAVDDDEIDQENEAPLHKSHTREIFGGLLKLRSKEDDDPTDWWFASTAIPLIAATFAPMANMLSIAALVVYWRNDVTTDDPITRESTSYGVRDPGWCLDLNGTSLAFGFIGNMFLLFNMTRKVRYIIALPVTILFFFIASGILIGITAGMVIYAPARPDQVYSQGFWHAIIASCLYMLTAILLMINMLGYFLGHYPQHFDLNDEQRNLILQTMIFFIWLAGGAGVFAHLEPEWDYPDALYFCDVTLLTIGFGDYYATKDVGRGLVFPFSVGGTIILGLMVSSIHRFAQELSKDKVVRKHIETRRVSTLSRAVSLDDPSVQSPFTTTSPFRSMISRPLEGAQIQNDLDKVAADVVANRAIQFQDANKEDYISPTDTVDEEPAPTQFRFGRTPSKRSTLRAMTFEPLHKVASMRHRVPALLPNRSQKAILMKDEKDRFDRMRDIQYSARRFKKWYQLTLSVISFGLLWCVGAVVFYIAEKRTQNMSYFQALYFCYVSLLTIGYGDLSPRSNAGKAFFLLWSLIAVPTMTILVSDLGDTVIGGFKRRTLKYGSLFFLGKDRGWGLDWFTQQGQRIQRRWSHASLALEKAPKLESGANKKIAGEKGLQGARRSPDQHEDDLDEMLSPRTLEQLANDDVTEPEMLRRLAHAIRRVADDLRHDPRKQYGYEEWVDFTRLVRFTRIDRTIQDSPNPLLQLEYDEAIDGIVDWDWLDKDSPMTSEHTEAEWLMDRLLESLLRVFRRKDLLRVLTSTEEHVEHHHRRPSIMSIHHARRYSSKDNTHVNSEIAEESNNKVEADGAGTADGRLGPAGENLPPNRSKTSPPDLNSDNLGEDTAIWSKRGQAKNHRIQKQKKAHDNHNRNGSGLHLPPQAHRFHHNAFSRRIHSRAVHHGSVTFPGNRQQRAKSNTAGKVQKPSTVAADSGT